MKKNILIISILTTAALSQQLKAQDCKTDAELDAVPGKYLTAAQYPWPAARAEYFSKMTTAADKAIAKQVLGQIEKIEAQSHTGFNLTGGNWENYYTTDGYQYFGNNKSGQYSFRAALYEYFCAKGKLTRNSEYSSILRIYVNQLALNTLNSFLSTPFGNSFPEYDFGIQFQDWKNHKPADVNAQLITLFTYMTCKSPELLKAINTGENYFQDVADKDIRPNSRSNYIYRYWFIKKKEIPVVVPVSRKEYLQSLLEYYEREKIHFTKLVAKLKEDKSGSLRYYSSWEKDVADKISVVNKELTGHDEKWLSQQAFINKIEDAGQSYKSKLTEQTNKNRFWKFYDDQKNDGGLYKYNPAYFKNSAKGPASPQLITVAFRYVTIPSSLRLLNNFTKQFDFAALQKMLE